MLMLTLCCSLHSRFKYISRNMLQLTGLSVGAVNEIPTNDDDSDTSIGDIAEAFIASESGILLNARYGGDIL